MQPTSKSNKQLGKVAARGTFWTYAAFFSGKLLSFLTTVILARILVQEDFGIAAYALVVINFLDVFSEFGLGPALIYHRQTPGSADTAFWSGLATALAIFLITWFAAPLIGLLFNDERAIGVTRALALTFPISSLGNIHDALLRKELSFQRRFLPMISQSLGRGLVSVGLALFGFGAWSLIIGQIFGTVISVVMFWIVCPWRPSFHFAPSTARNLLSYGLSTVFVNMIAALVVNVDYLFVGRFLGAAMLGIYTVAFRIPQLLILQICDPLSKVIFPMYAKMRDDPTALQRGFLTTMHYIALVTFPLGIALTLTARPFILFIYGERWAEAIPVMQAISIYAMMLSLSYNTGDIHKAQGRMMLMTKIALFRLGLLLPLLWWATSFSQSIVSVGIVHILVAFIAVIVNLVAIMRYLDITLNNLITTLQSAAIGSALLGVGISLTMLVSDGLPPIGQLLLCGLSGGIVYLVALWWLERDLCLMLLKTGRSLLQRMQTRLVRQHA